MLGAGEMRRRWRDRIGCFVPSTPARGSFAGEEPRPCDSKKGHFGRVGGRRERSLLYASSRGSVHDERLAWSFLETKKLREGASQERARGMEWRPSSAFLSLQEPWKLLSLDMRVKGRHVKYRTISQVAGLTVPVAQMAHQMGRAST